MTITRALCVGHITPAMMVVEVLPGVRLLMLPGESLEAVVESLRNHFSETDSLFDPGEPLDSEELDEMTQGDPNYQRWLDDGSPTAPGMWQQSNDWYKTNCRQRSVEWPVI